MRIAMATSIAAVLIGGAIESVLAQSTTGPASPVLTGAAAFGGWDQSKPGVRRLIRPSDLPPPNATPSASNQPRLVSRPPSPPFAVPAGFKVDAVASGFREPRVIRVAPNGDLFVADSAAGQVRLIRMGSADTKPSVNEIYATGLKQPYGIAFYPADNPQWVYVAQSDGVIRFAYKAGDTKATGKPETLVSGIPTNHHWTRDVAFSLDGKTMYFSVGSGSNVAEDVTGLPAGGIAQWAATHPLGLEWGPEENRAAVLAFDPDGKNKRVVATGLRNCSGMTVQPATGDLWCVVNERDNLGDNLVPDFATRVQAGAFYGWPWYYIGNHEDPRPMVKGQRPDLAAKVTVPDVLIQAHSAPLNIAFYDGDTFPAEYKGSPFVALHGSWNRGMRTGYKIVRLIVDQSGKPTGEYEDFMTGFVLPSGEVWGRPVGVATGKDGSLYVTEDGSGSVWRVSYSRAPS